MGFTRVDVSGSCEEQFSTETVILRLEYPSFWRDNMLIYQRFTHFTLHLGIKKYAARYDQTQAFLFSFESYRKQIGSTNENPLILGKDSYFNPTISVFAS